MIKTLSSEELVTATGGAATVPMPPLSCDGRDPTGFKPPTQFAETDHSGPSMRERVERAWQRAMGPWQTFNDLFKGKGPRAPRPPRSINPP